MKRIHTLLFLMLFGFVATAQNYKPSNSEIEEYKSQIPYLVRYLEETLNFIGSPENTAQEKDIIFTESYLKMFKDEDVQIEDDLDATRRTFINKDVRSYLKDVDFFYKNVVFGLNIQKVEPLINEAGDTYFKVSMMRELHGRNIGNDTVSDTRQRFLEINLDPYKKDLKIVSFYTTKLNEKESLRSWWNEMPVVWKNYFGTSQYLYDSVEMCDIASVLEDSYTILKPEDFIRCDSFMIVADDTLEMTMTDQLFGHRPDTVVFINDTVVRWVSDTIKADMEPFFDKLNDLKKIKIVDVSGNAQINSLNPLSELDELEYLDCSKTAVSDLSAIRNLNKIKKLVLNNTNVTDISDLRYFNAIRYLDVDSTQLSDLSVVGHFSELTTLAASNTNVTDFSPVSQCLGLETLELSNDNISNIGFLSNLTSIISLEIFGNNIVSIDSISSLVNLQYLNIKDTQITDLSPLANMSNLYELQCSNTKVSNLDALSGLHLLSRIYCDNTLINANVASDFMMENPNTLVVYETQALGQWWDELPVYWKTIFSEQCHIANEPTTEDLHIIINMKTLAVDKTIQDIVPVGRLTNLERLDLSKTKTNDISMLYGLHHLKYLNLANTKISDISVLRNINVQELDLTNTNVGDLTPLHNNGSLRLVHADGSKVSEEEVIILRNKQPQAKVVYQTEALNSWWGLLSAEWRDIFRQHVECDATPTAEQLQEIVDLEELVIDDAHIINSLEPLSYMFFLKKLVVDNNRVQDLTPLEHCFSLKEISISGNPVTDLSPLSTIPTMETLNLENTPVVDLTPLTVMNELKVLNVGGTLVKNLKPLANLQSLEDVSIINTKIKSLEPIEKTPSLKHIKAYNTKLKAKKVEELRAKRPELNILFY